MTDEKPKKKETKTPSESQIAIAGAKQNAQGIIQTTVIPGIKSLIQFAPVGGSGFAFFSFLLEQQWALVLITFPATILAVIWAAYSESVLTRFYEIYKARGAKDVDSLMAWIEKVDKVIKETIKWQLAGVEDKYLKVQGNTCKDFKTEGYKPGLSIFTPLLNEVFVPLDLSSAFMRNLEGKSLPLPPGFKWDKKTIELVQKDGLRIWDILKQTKKFTAYRRLAILSWGGYGKTTLLRHITYIYTNKKDGRYKAPKLLPVLILLRQWQKNIAETKDLDLPGLIENYHIPKLPQVEELKLPPNWAKNHLKNGKMLVMFDGFDEVKEGWRTKISAWLGEEMSKYPKTNFILTSRPSAYNEHFLTEYKLQAQLFVKPFNRNQQERFINNWYWCQEKLARGARDTPDVKAEAVSNAHNLLQQLEKRPELNDLAKNPLLLNIITNLHRCYPTEELPKRRSELYREIVNLQLGNRPLARKIDLALPLNEAQEVLQGLALYMVRENKPTVAEDVLLEQVREPIKNFDKSVVAKDFIRGVVDVSELLVKRDEDYEFAHLSFQGYLAAKEIIRINRGDLLINNWEKAWWRETILLYAAQVNPNSLLKQLINIGTKEAVALAYDCIKETPRQIEPEVEKELENIEGTVENLLYQDLETYLKNGQWKEADEETDRLMLQIGDKSNKGYLDEEDIKDFPCEDLRIINDLWVKNSQGKFGFTVQRDIWLSCGGEIEKYKWEPYKKFAVEVRWYSKGEWFVEMEYDLSSATMGHLPLPPILYNHLGMCFSSLAPSYSCFSSLTPRLVTCNI